MVPQTFSNVAQAQGPRPLARRATGSPRLFGAAAMAALLASSHTFANVAGDASGMTQERHVCTIVLGLDRSGPQYDACIRSLHRSLAAWNRTQLVQTDRRACAERGLEPGTAAFAVCVVNTDQSAPNTGGYGTIAPAY